MNYIFLDIDGVLNSEPFLLEQVRANPNRKFVRMIDEKAVEVLAKACRWFNAVVVISSSWRVGWHRDSEHILELKDLLNKYNIKVVGLTTVNGDDRGQQIWEYIDHHLVSSDSYVILDDDPVEDHPDFRFVNTSFKEGLLEAHLEKIEASLKIPCQSV